MLCDYGRKILFSIFNVRLDLRKINYVLGSAGVAGCMATVLHDAIMNPAEGSNTHTDTHTAVQCCTVQCIYRNLRSPSEILNRKYLCCCCIIWPLGGAPDSAFTAVVSRTVSHTVWVYTVLFIYSFHPEMLWIHDFYQIFPPT